MRTTHTRADFEHSPMIVFYQATRACDLACRHCRASAQCERHPDELSTAAAQAMIRELARFPKPPLLVITGGDPIKRADVFNLIAFARQQALQMAMTQFGVDRPGRQCPLRPVQLALQVQKRAPVALQQDLE